MLCIWQIEKRAFMERNPQKTLFFEASAQKKEVLEEMIRRAGSKLDRGNPSEFRLECKFPLQ